tara:strand:- start:254 stop:481 length:228 start_codon:yes stop_codon:yes gene_type:complete
MNEMSYDASNIIDFTVVKLEKMRGEASNIAWFEMVEQIDVALALYNEGKATIKWVDGEPLITVKEKTNEDNQEQT